MRHLLHAETLNQLFTLQKFTFFSVEPHRMNKTCLCDGGGLVKIEIRLQCQEQQELDCGKSVAFLSEVCLKLI